MCFRILFTIFVISANSQVNSELIDARAVAERLVNISTDLANISKRIQIILDKNSTNITFDELAEPSKDTSSTQADIDRITKELGHCTAILEPVTTANSAQKSTVHEPSLIAPEPTATSVPKHDNGTGKEVWNQLTLPTNVLRNLLKKQRNISEEEFQLEMNSFNYTKSLICKDFIKLTNKIWEGLLIMNLLKIKCYSGDETLKELWFKIPQPSAPSELGHLNLTELWFNQTLPSMPSDEPSEPIDNQECKVVAMEKGWDKVNYQLLFRRVLQIKYSSNDKESDEWNKIVPNDLFKQNDVMAKKVWNQLTLPELNPKSGDEAFMFLWSQLYQPLAPEMGKWVQFNF